MIGNTSTPRPDSYSSGTMTHNTREVESTTAEKLAHEIGDLFDDGFTTPTFGQIEKIETLIHQELQKARHDWLREEIVRLEGMQEKYTHPDDNYNQALQTIIDRYQAELDQEVSK